MAALHRYNAELVRRCAAEGVRFDGRSATTGREVDISLIRGDCVAVAEVTLGETRALCRVGLERVPGVLLRRRLSFSPPWFLCGGRSIERSVVSPRLMAPDASRACEGKVTVTVDVAQTILGLAHNRGGLIDVNRIAERTVRDVGAIDKEALCVVGGAWVWAVAANVHVLAYDGNLEDAVSLAALAALRHARKPVVDVVVPDEAASGDNKSAPPSGGGRKRGPPVRTTPDGRVLVVRGANDAEPLPLPLLRAPLTVTYAFLATTSSSSGSGGPRRGEEEEIFDDDAAVLDAESTCVIDPTLAEEVAAVATLTVGYDAHAELCAFQKVGGGPVSADVLIRCAKQAAVRAKKLHAHLKLTLETADDKWREARTNQRRAALRAAKDNTSPSSSS